MTVLRTTPEGEASGLTAVLALGVELDRPPTLSPALQDALLAPLETPRT
jgi:hypothetical protein